MKWLMRNIKLFVTPQTGFPIIPGAYAGNEVGVVLMLNVLRAETLSLVATIPQRCHRRNPHMVQCPTAGGSAPWGGGDWTNEKHITCQSDLQCFTAGSLPPSVGESVSNLASLFSASVLSSKPKVSQQLGFISPVHHLIKHKEADCQIDCAAWEPFLLTQPGADKKEMAAAKL